MLEAFYDWVATRSPKYREQRFQRAHAESQVACLETCLEAKKKQVAELQRAVSGIQRSRDQVEARSTDMRFQITTLPDGSKRAVRMPTKTPGELIDQGAAMIKESIEKGEPIVMLHRGR